MNFLQHIPKTPGVYVGAAGAVGALLVAVGFLLAEESAQLAAAVGQVAGGIITIFTIVAAAVGRAKTKPKE